MNEKNDTFSYIYSSETQKEILSIRKKYETDGQSNGNKLERLRKLDRSASRPGTIVSLTIGIISSLIFGLGMSCIMLWSENLFIPGIIIGITGLAGIIAAAPIYSIITKNRRKKIAPEIIRLSEELMK